MIKLTVRHLCLGGVALALAVLSLLSLLFAPVAMDFSQFEGLFQDYGIFFRQVQENGFALLDGNSGVVEAFELFAQGYAETSGINYALPSLKVLEIFSQVFNILILVCSILMCGAALLWLFTVKSERIVKTIALASVWVGAVYLIEGLLFVIFLNSEWHTLLGADSDVQSLFIENIFTTYGYIPLILIAVFEIVFWCVYYKVGEGHPVYDTESIAPVNETAGACAQAEQGYFEKLKKLKELYDEGVLTEQEFNDEKAKILNK